MSGIVGIFHRNGAPVAAESLRALVAFQHRVGPYLPSDAQDVWIDGPIGLGHHLLRTGAVPLDTAQFSGAPSPNPPAAHLRVTADVRLDSRPQLRAELSSSGRQISSAASDEELLLHSYALWGPNCVAHLRGDFAFAIWDANSRTLFCARDHFGIKPFYYVAFESLFLFSNTLNALRLYPGVSAALNDVAVADFLLFGLNCDNSTTTFRDIQRLPPAHTLLVSRDALQLYRYWEVPATGHIRYPRASDYVENFLAVWNSAVADRLDTSPTGILLSGGLDSAAVAATAKEQSSSPNLMMLRAFTVTHQNLRADRDPQYAAALANSLGIPLQSIAVSDLHPFEHWDDLAPISPEPVDDPLFANLPLSFKQISAVCRVLLSGEGGDNLMHFQMGPYAADLFRHAEWLRLVNELAQFVWRRPFPWRGLRVRFQGLFGQGESAPQPFPKWIASDFAKRFDLPARWQAGQPLPVPPQPHPIHPTAHVSLYLPQWTHLFELENPGVTKCPIEVRYPFLDLRVVEYLLAIPPFPWLFQKSVLRQAMAGRVPNSVRLRPKTAFAGDPLLEQLRRSGPFPAFGASNDLQQPSDLRWTREAGQYINASLLAPLHAKMLATQVRQSARPFCFNFWLQSVRGVRYN